MHCRRQQRDDKALNGHAFGTDGEGCSDDFDMSTTVGISPAQPAHEVQTNIYIIYIYVYIYLSGIYIYYITWYTFIDIAKDVRD